MAGCGIYACQVTLDRDLEHVPVRKYGRTGEHVEFVVSPHLAGGIDRRWLAGFGACRGERVIEVKADHSPPGGRVGVLLAVNRNQYVVLHHDAGIHATDRHLVTRWGR